MSSQIVVGGLVSIANFVIHALITGLIVVATAHTAALTSHRRIFWRVSALLLITTSVLMCAHLVEVAVWATFYAAMGVTATPIGVFEFAFENYTTLGYGDALPASGQRLYVAITSLNGLLLIGWSVAIIFEVLRMAEFGIGGNTR